MTRMTHLSVNFDACLYVVQFQFPKCAHQAPFVQTLDRAIHWINHYPLDNSIGFASVYPLDSDLSSGQRYPSFEQLGPELLRPVSRGVLFHENKI